MKKPHFDAHLYMFKTEENISRQEEIFYTKVRNYLIKKFIIIALIISCAITSVFSVISYNAGYDSYVEIVDDSPAVYIMPSGKSIICKAAIM